MSSPPNSISRIPPQALDAERAVLAAMLLSQDAIATAIETIKPEDFYRESHQMIYQAVLDLYDRGEPCDLVSLRESLVERGQLDRVGNVPYLTDLFEYTITAANIAHHCRIVRERSVLRALINVSTEVASKAYDITTDATELLNTAEQRIFELAEGRIKRGFEDIRTWVKPTMETFSDLSENHRHITGVETGLQDLDRLTAGWQPTDLIIIAARPSMGKTALMLRFAQHVAIQLKEPVAIFSLEMSAQQLTQRILCAEAKVSMHAARTGRLNDQGWQNLTHAASRLGEAPIYIDDTPGLTVLEMRAKARRLKATSGLKLILVDYLQLVVGDSRADNRALEIGGVSRGLKALAKELDVPVVTGAQLSRAIEQRTDRKPLLSDLRESGSIEQDADLVCFIHRPEVYDKTKPELENYAELIVGKHRNGPTDTIQLSFHKEWARFDSYISSSYDELGPGAGFDPSPELPQ